MRLFFAVLEEAFRRNEGNACGSGGLFLSSTEGERNGLSQGENGGFMIWINSSLALDDWNFYFFLFKKYWNHSFSHPQSNVGLAIYAECKQCKRGWEIPRNWRIEWENSRRLSGGLSGSDWWHRRVHLRPAIGWLDRRQSGTPPVTRDVFWFTTPSDQFDSIYSP